MAFGFNTPSLRPPYFSGSYHPKKVIKVAPDAFVTINGSYSLSPCSRCNKSFNVNDYITSINIDLNINSTPGTATINMSIPRHDINNFYGDGEFLIKDMMEIQIWMKGYFTVYGVPQYYPVFWGLITGITQDYSAGEHTASLSCKDILYWWEVTRINVTPSFSAAHASEHGLALLGNVFAGANPYDILFSLSRTVAGDLFLGAGSLVASQPDTERAQSKQAIKSIAEYWRARFANIRNSLVMYGINGSSICSGDLQQFADDLEKKMQQAKHTSKNFKDAHSKYLSLASSALSSMEKMTSGLPQGQQYFLDPTSQNIVGFKNMFTQAGEINLWQSQYMTKLEIANHVKGVIGFEFYMDSTGDIIFKPPFYNLDVAPNDPISHIKDIDIIESGFSSSAEEVITALTMKGSWSSKSEYGISEDILPSSTVIDYKLLAQYGWRQNDYSSEWITSPKALFFHGLDVLDRLNANRFTGTVRIPLRPELRMGFPVYFETRDEYWYVEGISHSLSYGGQATTNLTFKQRRGRFIPPANMLVINSTSQLPDTLRGDTNDYGVPNVPRDPATGKIVGVPNVALVYGNALTDQDVKNLSNFSPDSMTAAEKKQLLEQIKKANSVGNSAANGSDVVQNDPSGEALATAMNFLNKYGSPGMDVYRYAQLPAPVTQAEIDSINLPRDDKGKPTSSTTTATNTNKELHLVFPVSDEKGYDHIGNYSYGRGLQLSGGGIRQVGQAVALTTSSSPDVTMMASVLSDDAADFLNMIPSDERGQDNTPPQNTSPQPVQSSTKGGLLEVQLDSVARGVQLSQLIPNNTQESTCQCTLSRAQLDLFDLLHEGGMKRMFGVWSLNTTEALLDEVFGHDYSQDKKTAHSKYEDDITKSKT